MTRELRKGWCPGALRPMPARDGLLVRLRITGGIVSAATATALAVAAELYGNGFFDLSARANLQMRGVRDDALPALLDTLHDLGLLDRDPAGEAVRNVLGSPLAGTHHGLDIRPLVAALEVRLTNEPALHAMPGKFGFLVDDGSAPSLAGEVSDVRFDWVESERDFLIGLGGTRHDALRIGRCAPDELVDRAVATAERLLALQVPEAQPMRAAAWLRAKGRAAVADAFDTFDIAPAASQRSAFDSAKVAGLQTFNNVATLGAVAPFGRLDARMLAAAASAASKAGDNTLRLTPWRAILLPHISPHAIDEKDLREKGLILDPSDPRLRVAACVGQDGCDRATTPTRRDGASLAPFAAAFGEHGFALHVSGCIKGCAKPSPSPLTLVGREGRYDLVIDGCASDTPACRGLDVAEACDRIAALPGLVG